MKSTPLPNLSSLHQQLANDTQRIERFLDSLPFHMDNLLVATKYQDWSEVQRQSEYLASAGEDCSLQEVTQAAISVQKAIDGNNLLKARRAVISLVSKCGTAKMPNK